MFVNGLGPQQSISFDLLMLQLCFIQCITVSV
jgi:hypothetical protein